MTHRIEKSSSDPMRTAAEWYWQIREPEVSESEIREWQAWLAESPVHQQAFDRIEHALKSLADVDMERWPTEEELLRDRYDASVPVDEWLRATNGDDRNRSGQTGPGDRRLGISHRALAIAASVLVAVAIGIFYQSQSGRERPVPDVVAYQTIAAEHRDIQLPDGSKVAMGGSTEIAVAYGPSSRIVELRNGEAFFDVARDPDRPFEVVAGGRRIVAVGTSFNVTRQASRVTLTVTEGQVIVEQESRNASTSQGGSAERTVADGRIARLDAGQRIVFDDEDIEPITFAGTDDALAWQTGVLKYRGERLLYVIEDVNRYTTSTIQVVDDTAANLLFTGTVFQDSAESWVYGLEDAFPVRVERSATGVTIYSRQP